MAECAIINNKRISSNMKKERTIMKKLQQTLVVGALLVTPFVLCTTASAMLLRIVNLNVLSVMLLISVTTET